MAERVRDGEGGASKRRALVITLCIPNMSPRELRGLGVGGRTGVGQAKDKPRAYPKSMGRVTAG